MIGSNLKLIGEKKNPLFKDFSSNLDITSRENKPCNTLLKIIRSNLKLLVQATFTHVKLVNVRV